MPRMVVIPIVGLIEISSYSKLKQLNVIFVQRIRFFCIGFHNDAVILTTLADAKRTSMTNTYCVYTVLRYS